MLDLQRYCQTKNMELKHRIIAFAQLGKKISDWLTCYELQERSPLDSVIRQAYIKNGWFDESQIIGAIDSVNSWLNQDSLNDWTEKYEFGTNTTKLVGVIMAGNIPLVGYHDYLSVLISGHKLLAKLSSKDEVLIKFLHQELVKLEPEFEGLVDFSTERFTNVDAVIATGSDNSSKYFEYYFSGKPNIIRRNRTSVAVLTGNETKKELHQLGNDIFSYYGLGCRSITKVYLPKGFDIDWFYTGILEHGEVINNHKYQNNYDYHKSLYLLNGDKLWDNNFLLMKEDSSLTSPVGVLYFEEYENIKELEEKLATLSDQIQCRVGIGGFDLGNAQTPRLDDYSDNIDVMEFLLKL